MVPRVCADLHFMHLDVAMWLTFRALVLEFLARAILTHEKTTPEHSLKSDSQEGVAR